MSQSIQDGGNAFPTFEADDQRGYGGNKSYFPVGGMTLRDYFAAQAMGLLSRPVLAAIDGGHRPPSREEVARLCYQIADAMIAARQTQSPTLAQVALEAICKEAASFHAEALSGVLNMGDAILFAETVKRLAKQE